MPKSLAREEDALQKILFRIEEETLDPAKNEASKIIDEAKREAEKIRGEAEKARDQILQEGRLTIEKERGAALTALQQAARENIEALKQKVQNEFFETKFFQMIDQKLQEKEVLEKIIDALLETLKKEGIQGRFSLVLPKVVSKEELAKIGAKSGLKALEGDAKVGDLSGGVQVKLHDKHLTLDFSSHAIHDLLLPYMRKDLRELLFGKEK